MANKQILDYVQKSLEGGYSVEQITTALSSQGWSPEEINEALLKTQEIIQKKSAEPILPPVPPKRSEWNIELKNLSASQILLYLGGLIVVLAGIIYIGINWSQWGPAARIFAIFLPTFICYAAGTPMFFSNEHKKQGIVFVVVGSLLVPFFLSVTFKELELFAQPFNDNFGLAVSFVTFALYLGLNFVYRFPIWAFLYQTAGLFLYYYLWRVLGIKGALEEPTLAWLFLLPGTGYLLFSLLYDRSGKKEEAHYSYVLGALVVILSFVRLLTETFVSEHLSWLLLLFGVGYFAFGSWLERNDIKKYCSIPYLIGTGLTFFSLLRLGFDGTLLKNFNGSIGYEHDIIGWSNVIVGTVYLLIAWGVSNLKKFKMEEGASHKEFFNLVGSFVVLAAIFYLGLGDKKPLYESLLLLSSLGFIFGSIPKATSQFLYVGTLFLVVYIFSIGGEYFQNDVGWPITLFVAGLISMGIGVAIEKVRKKYFVPIKL